MGKIDFTAIKRQKQEQEAQAQDTAPEGLMQSYTSVWGKNKETVEYIERNRLNVFCDDEGREQPFKINSAKVEQIKLSAADIGIITPLIVRKYESDYQIISGHHRLAAAKELNLLTVPCVVREVSDEETYQYVIESNIQRMKTLPSEYGRIFHCYLAMRKDIDITAQEIADKFGISKRSMFRYEKVTALIPELQEYADKELINIDSVENIVKFSEENQRIVCKFIIATEEKHKITAALSKKMTAIVENYGGDTVPLEDFTALIAKPTVDNSKRIYKNAVYNSVAQKCKIECSEKELDDIVASLLEEYFKSRN